MLTMTRKEQALEALLLDAFVDAGRRGLTAAEMHARVGGGWPRRLAGLEDAGCEFREHRSRFARGRRGPGRVFRWELVHAPDPDVAGDELDDAVVDEQLALLDPPAVPPASAIAGETDAC